MKLRLFLRAALVIVVVLVCAGIGVYSYLHLRAMENKQEFDLYTLVPQDAIAVVETDRMAALVDDINNLHCSRDDHFLYISDLFVYLKRYLHDLVGDTPHGLSKQMNKMLLSFHEPDNPSNQVLFCSLGAGDYQLIETFVEKYAKNTNPPEVTKYKGTEIRGYTVPDGHVLWACFTKDFLAISFQKRLIEQVVDTRREKTSLMDLPSFRTMYGQKRGTSEATVYVRMKAVDMGRGELEAPRQTRVGSWAEFDMKFNEDAIYCSGVSYGADTTRTFINAMHRQEPIREFPGERLPASTFFYYHFALSDIEPVADFATRQAYHDGQYPDSLQALDAAWVSYLEEHAGDNLLFSLFQPKDTMEGHLPCAVMAIPMKNEKLAERRLQLFLERHPVGGMEDLPGQSEPEYERYPLARNHTQYRMPSATLLTQLTGMGKPARCSYACFYRGALLLAPDARSLSAYIDSLERGFVLDGTSAYEEGVGSLSPLYNFVMMVDMEAMLHQPENYGRLVPNFFFRQMKFFRHFVLDVQFICKDDVTYPNIVLLYRG
ncbi:MAG: DUF3352 domain-containing protein [Prevotellaceae bacterium]|nr:DUF3352 domain-containing protein [Prevotellaceae bacterium]